MHCDQLPHVIRIQVVTARMLRVVSWTRPMRFTFGRLFALKQGFRLCDGIGQKHLVHVLMRTGRLYECDEFHWMNLSPLVQQLIESMLAVGTRLAPDHGTAVPSDRLTFPVNELSIALHVRLLQIRRQTVGLPHMEEQHENKIQAGFDSNARAMPV